MTREEAINTVRNIYQTDKEKEALETLIPELRESEDERIRKELIGMVKFHCPDEYLDRYLNWLEKQKEQKPVPKFSVGDYVIDTNYKGEPLYQIVGIDKECYICEYRGDKEMGDRTVMHFAFNNPYLRLEQKPAEWSEEDEKMLTGIIERGSSQVPFGEPALRGEQMEWLMNMLKSHRPQPKQEWSEEDDRKRKELIQYLEEKGDYRSVWMTTWLKSLRPSWKPSEEQMDALAYAIQLLDDGISPKAAKAGEELEHLREQLKKLM